MITMNRRRFLASSAVGASALGILSRPASAAEFVYKFGNNVPETHPTNVAARKAAERILHESGGRVEIKLFPNNQLGADTDMLSQVRSGALELYMLSPLVLANLLPVAGVSGIGFAFPNYDVLWQAMDGELGTVVRAEMAKVQLVAMPKIWDNGFRQMTSSAKPILAAADLKNMKIRVPVSPIWTSLFKALGAAPVGINFAELYTALQTKVVDGQENPLSIIQFGKLYEVQKYCSFTSHMWDGFWFVANKRHWDRLPANLREIVARNIDIAADEQRSMIRALNESLQGELASKGMVFAEADKASFRTAAAEGGFYKEWKAKFGDQTWALLQKYSGELA